MVLRAVDQATLLYYTTGRPATSPRRVFDNVFNVKS